MKTKNNVQKAILRSVAVIVSFVLISFTVNAQNFWKQFLENSSFNTIALAMVDAPVETEVLAETEILKAMSFTTETEPEMELESWMTDISNFDVPEFAFEVALDANLNVEEWMLDEEVFLPVFYEEGALQMEDWMVTESVWNI